MTRNLKIYFNRARDWSRLYAMFGEFHEKTWNAEIKWGDAYAILTEEELEMLDKYYERKDEKEND